MASAKLRHTRESVLILQAIKILICRIHRSSVEQPKKTINMNVCSQHYFSFTIVQKVHLVPTPLFLLYPPRSALAPPILSHPPTYHSCSSLAASSLNFFYFIPPFQLSLFIFSVPPPSRFISPPYLLPILDLCLCLLPHWHKLRLGILSNVGCLLLSNTKNGLQNLLV